MFKVSKKAIKLAVTLTILSMIFDYGDEGGISITRSIFLFLATVLVFDGFVFLKKR